MAMRLSGLAFLSLLILPCTQLVSASVRAPLLALALVPYHLYFSQLYCEAHVGAHVTALVPPALLLLALCPALDEPAAAAADPDAASTAASTAAFTCWLMKIVLTSAYCSAGVCKISHSIRSLAAGRSSWCSGSTLQAFIFEAMFLSTASTHTSFGVPTPFSHAMQRLHVRFPRALLLPASFGAVAFETAAPLLLLAPAHLASVPFALCGIAFHYGIALLQNIDFVSWWGPVYAFLLADPAAWAGGALFTSPDDAADLGLVGSTAVALRVAPMRATIALAYVGLHLLALVVLRFFPTVEMLPLSCFPMFGSPQNLFDASQRKWFWLTGKAHATGTLKNYAFPFCRAHTVEPHELPRLPYPYILYGHGGLAADGVSRLAPTIHANVQITTRLATGLEKLTNLGNQSKRAFAVDGGTPAANAILTVLDELKAGFAEAPRIAATKEVPVDDLPAVDATMSTPMLHIRGGASAGAPAEPGPAVARPVILFDGVCLLCSTFIQFVLDHDGGTFDFATLQGATGTKLLTQHGLPLDVSTVVMIDEAGVHTRSTAALRVLRKCGMPYAILYAAILLPRPLRDLGYKAVAAVRYRIFGKDDGSSCRLMTKAIRSRFL